MELLPIIYVSLAIFAVVAFATIITSFLSYKIRSKTEGYKKPYEKVEDPSNKNYMKKKIMDSDGRFHTVISEGKKSEHKSRDKNQIKKSSNKPKVAASKTKNRTDENRIKIINKPSNIRLPELPVKTKEEKPKRKEIESNENILNKYTDDQNEEFFTPKISVKKKSE
ncbi:MAG: hypothetical protein KJ571_17400 [Bacteroidetes bacterium]|nr:hypothetical protein [Bacteroidota bacterium]